MYTLTAASLSLTSLRLLFPLSISLLSDRSLLCIRLRELGVCFGQGCLDTRAQGTLDGCHVVLLQELDPMWTPVAEGYYSHYVYLYGSCCNFLYYL
jgi:hypothetical protein